MLKSSLLSGCLVLFSYFFISLAHASYSSAIADPLQVYRDEIKQSESNASQAVLDTLKANADPDGPSSQKRPATASTATPAPRSNSDKAFVPSDTQSANSTHSSNKNPWLQPNPWANPPPNIWERNAKVNPYSNAPIPAPSPNLMPPNPPNIFSPQRQPSNPGKPRPNANF